VVEKLGKKKKKKVFFFKNLKGRKKKNCFFEKKKPKKKKKNSRYNEANIPRRHSQPPHVCTRLIFNESRALVFSTPSTFRLRVPSSFCHSPN